jgi:hypothetical protein
VSTIDLAHSRGTYLCANLITTKSRVCAEIQGRTVLQDGPKLKGDDDSGVREAAGKDPGPLEFRITLDSETVKIATRLISAELSAQ